MRYYKSTTDTDTDVDKYLCRWKWSWCRKAERDVRRLGWWQER